jgi:hypothetical protein
MASETGWCVAKVECTVCTHPWVALFPIAADEEALECPNCHYQDSEVLEYLGPERKGEIARGEDGEIIEYRPDA